MIQIRIMVIEDIPAGEVRTTKEAALISDLESAMDTLNLTLSKRDYLVGDRFRPLIFTLATTSTGTPCGLELNVVMQKYPSVVAYLERMRKHPAAVRADVFSYED